MNTYFEGSFTEKLQARYEELLDYRERKDLASNVPGMGAHPSFLAYEARIFADSSGPDDPWDDLDAVEDEISRREVAARKDL